MRVLDPMHTRDGSPEPWWQSAFQSIYADVYAHRDLEAARAEMDALIELGVEGRVLDLCCGFGRHLLALRRAGLPAFGVDWSIELLRQAAALPDAERVVGRIARADMRDLPLRAGSFDTVVCMFNSFGYFSDEQNERVACEIRRVLRADGRLYLDVMNAERVRRRLVPRSERLLGADRLIEERRLSGAGDRVEKDITLQSATGPTRSWRESVRMYEPGELARVLARAGLDVERTFGDFGGAAFASDSERMLVVARARAAAQPT